jgi:hypothetical protein
MHDAQKLRSVLAKAVVCAVLMTAGVAPPAQSQSLGEIAQKAKAARAKAEADRAKAQAEANGKAPAQPSSGSGTSPKAGATKTFTNESLKSLPPSPDTSPALSAPSSQVKPQAAPGSEDASPKATSENVPQVMKDEAWWRARMSKLRTTLAEAETTFAAKTVLVARLERVRDNVPERGYSVAQAYAEASAELAKARSEATVAAGAVRAAKLAIEDAEEEARVSGALPGWLR